MCYSVEINFFDFSNVGEIFETDLGVAAKTSTLLLKKLIVDLILIVTTEGYNVLSLSLIFIAGNTVAMTIQILTLESEHEKKAKKTNGNGKSLWRSIW